MTGEKQYVGSPDNPRTGAVVAYITIIGWLIAYFALYNKDRNGLTAFHLRQALMLHVLSFLINILTYSLMLSTGRFIAMIFALALFIFYLMGIFSAAGNKKTPIPIIGSWAQSVFRNL